MKMNKQSDERALRELIGTRESKHVEYRPALDAELGHVVCAFLNSVGGRLIIGVDEHGQLVGRRFSQKHVDRIKSQLADQISPAGMWAISRESHARGDVIIIDVPKGTKQPYTADKAIYSRQSTRTILAPVADVSAMIVSRSAAEERWERQVATGAALEDLDQQRIRRVQQAISRTNPDFFRGRKGIIPMLSRLGLYRDGQITNAGLVVFGKTPGRFLPQACVRLIVADDKTKNEYRVNERLDVNLFTIIERLQRAIVDFTSHHSRFAPDHWQRQDASLYPPQVLREAIMNALVHRDLSSYKGGMSVELYNDRVEVWNYGALPDELSIRGLHHPHPSLPRNPDIAAVCFLTGYIEQIGRGTVMILNECKRYGLPPPKWTTGRDGTRITLYSNPTRGARSLLNSRQIDALVQMRPDETYDTRDYIKLTQSAIASPTASRELVQLADLGFLERIIIGRRTKFRRIPF